MASSERAKQVKRGWLSLAQAQDVILRKLFGERSPRRIKDGNRSILVSPFTLEEREAAKAKLFDAIRTRQVVLHWRAAARDPARTPIDANDIPDISTYRMIIEARRTTRAVPNPALNHLVDKIIEVPTGEVEALRFDEKGDERVHRQKRGRRPKYDWSGARRHLFEALNYHGDIDPQDTDGWNSQAAMERSLLHWFSEKNPEHVPSLSVVRSRVKQFHAAWLAEKSEK